MRTLFAAVIGLAATAVSWRDADGSVHLEVIVCDLRDHTFDPEPGTRPVQLIRVRKNFDDKLRESADLL